jgi:hypothetical protein
MGKSTEFEYKGTACHPAHDSRQPCGKFSNASCLKCGLITFRICQATMRGDPERIMLWTQVITGFEVDELTAVRVLDAATWQQRRQRLQELGPQHD